MFSDFFFDRLIQSPSSYILQLNSVLIIITGPPPTHSVGSSIFLLSGACRRRL